MKQASVPCGLISFLFPPYPQGDTKANDITSEDIENESKVSNLPGASAVETDTLKADQLPQVDPICKSLFLSNSLLKSIQSQSTKSLFIYFNEKVYILFF